MIEKTILDYLEGFLESIPVYMEEPTDKPETYILIEKTASSDLNHVQDSTIAIQAYGPTLYDAAYLSGRVKTAMRVCRNTLSEVSRCKLNAEYNFTDQTTKRYRYQSVWNITHYEEE